jgi:hypothetical protein
MAILARTQDGIWLIEMKSYGSSPSLRNLDFEATLRIGRCRPPHR